MSKKRVMSPCIGVCKYKIQSRCIGCSMTKKQKKHFKAMKSVRQKRWFLATIVGQLEVQGGLERWAGAYRRRCEKKGLPCALNEIKTALASIGYAR